MPLCPGVQGVVFNDLNGNGLSDPGEAGLAGAEVTLGDLSFHYLATYVTGTDGAYYFYRLALGNYSLMERNPAGYTESTTPDDWGIMLTGCHIIKVNFGDRVPPPHRRLPPRQRLQSVRTSSRATSGMMWMVIASVRIMSLC